MRLRKRVPHVRVINRSAAATFTNFKDGGKIGPKKRRLIAAYRASSSNTYMDDSSIRVAPTSIGTQSIFSLNSCDIGFLKSCISSVGNTVNPSASNLSQTARWFLRTHVMHMSFSNQSNHQLMFDVYVYKCRRDAASSVATLWDSGYQDQVSGTTTNGQYTSYGASPLDVVSIPQFWKLHKVYHHCLNPGQAHEMRHTTFYNKVINNELLKNESGNVNYSAGLTYQYLVVTRGIPDLATTTTLGVGNTVVTEQAPQICCIYTRRLSFSYIKDEDRNSTFVINLPGRDTDNAVITTAQVRGADPRSATVSSGTTFLGTGAGEYFQNQA